MKVFISGRVTGLPRAEALSNFERGKRLLTENEYEFLSPLDVVSEEANNCEAMKILLPLLCDCDAILLLSDAKFSPGSHVEETTARYCGKLMLYEDDLT